MYFKIKKTAVDKFSEPGSFVGVVFSMGMADGMIQWVILSYDAKDDKYTRSKSSRDGSKFNQPYTVSLQTHKDIKQYIQQGSWKILKGKI
jgi:hypothetical protein